MNYSYTQRWREQFAPPIEVPAKEEPTFSEDELRFLSAIDTIRERYGRAPLSLKLRILLAIEGK